MLAAALLSVLFRVNLPIALLATFYTNPFTIIPLYVLAYQLGTWVLGQNGIASAPINTPDLSWDNWLSPLIQWMSSLGEAFVIGLPLLALLFAAIGYLLARIGWRFWVLWELSRRRARRHQLKEK